MIQQLGLTQDAQGRWVMGAPGWGTAEARPANAGMLFQPRSLRENAALWISLIANSHRLYAQTRQHNVLELDRMLQLARAHSPLLGDTPPREVVDALHGYLEALAQVPLGTLPPTPELLSQGPSNGRARVGGASQEQPAAAGPDGPRGSALPAAGQPPRMAVPPGDFLAQLQTQLHAQTGTPPAQAGSAEDRALQQARHMAQAAMQALGGGAQQGHAAGTNPQGAPFRPPWRNFQCCMWANMLGMCWSHEVLAANSYTTAASGTNLEALQLVLVA